MADDVLGAPTPLQEVEMQIETLQRKRRDLLRLAYYNKLFERGCKIGDDIRWGEIQETETQAFGSTRVAVLMDLINTGLEAEISRLSKG